MIPGSKEWLIAAEERFGGFITNVPRTKVSDIDPRSKKQLATGGMAGGDRMSGQHHGYAAHYETALRPFLGRPVVLVEVGILTGIGLAIWSDLFPSGQIIGLDIDLSHVNRNMAALKARGAFTNNNIELHEFDQLRASSGRFAEILSGRKVDILIDDGLHTNDAILTTLRSARPHLASEFVYIVEDNYRVHRRIRHQHPGWMVASHGELTVITPRGSHVPREGRLSRWLSDSLLRLIGR